MSVGEPEVSDYENPSISVQYRIKRSRTGQKGWGFTERVVAEVTVVVSAGQTRFSQDEKFPNASTIEDARKLMYNHMRQWLHAFRGHLSDNNIFPESVTLSGSEDEIISEVSFHSESSVIPSFTVTIPGAQTIKAAEEAASDALSKLLDRLDAYFAA